MKRIISLISIISISGILLIGCGNTDTKKDDNSNTEYTVSSTETNDGKKVKEEEGTVLENNQGIKTKIADANGNRLDKDLESQLRSECEEIAKITGSKDIEARPFNGVINFVLYGDIPSISTRKQEIINYLKDKPVKDYKQHVTIGDRNTTGGEGFNIE
jgi:hypothetical protein